MTVNELMAQIHTEMTGDIAKDLRHLSDIANDLRKEPNAGELIAAVAEHAFAIMPADQRAEMEEQTFVGGKRLDRAFGEALALVDKKDFAGAEAILAAISEKIAAYFEQGEIRYRSFRNPFEYHMCRYFYPEDTDFERAPFDFAHYLTLYGYVLVETGKPDEAMTALERAIRFNPVAAEPRFELAELCKLGRDYPRLLAVNQQTMPLCTTPDRAARVLANMGFYCYAVGDLFSAAVFYFESIRFLPFKPVELELQDTVRRMNAEGQKFTPPTHGQTIDTYEKYGLPQFPDGNLVSLALTLADTARQYAQPNLEGHFYRVAFDMTNEPQIKAKLDELDAEMKRRAEGGA